MSNPTVLAAAEGMPPIQTAETISKRVNALFARYVAIEAEQYTTSDKEHADALSSDAIEVAAEIWKLSDRTGNADFIAARVMLDLMLHHSWMKLDRVKEWDDDIHALVTLASVANNTTDVVRREARKVLATIGIHVENVPAAAEGAPEFLSLHADPAGLAHLSTTEICHLSEAIRTLHDVTVALSCQPRFESHVPHTYNAAGECLDAINELFSTCLVRLREELESRKPTDAGEAKLRAEHIVLDEASYCDDFSELVELCTSLELSVAEAGR